MISTEPNIYNYRVLLIVLLWLASFGIANSQIHAVLQNDTLTLSNSVVKRQFLWNNGELISFDLTNLKSGKNLLQNSTESTFKVNKQFKLKTSTFSSQKILENNIHCARLKAVVVLDYGSFKLKHEFRISENIPAIACDNYIFIRENSDLKDNVHLFIQPIEIERFKTNLSYPKLKAIEFFDRTDENNNLVKTQDVQSYTHQIKLKGNLLQISANKPGEYGIFVLKEAPCSFVQLSYPGHDFKSTNNTITVEGAGFSTEKRIKGEWVKLYGSVTGFFDGTDQGFKQALRTYQNSLRRSIPERDDMIMMNTWGDRNKDASISEAFLKAELDACEKLGISHFQIDDGWQEGLSQNSAQIKGNKWDLWKKEDWKPNAERLPNGLNPIVEYARKKEIQLGLWFAPSSYNSYENWETDADILLGLYKNYGICYFKIDGTQLLDKLSDHRLLLLFEKVSDESGGSVVINLDATAGNRTGYHYLNSYGNIFLENRYTDWGNYYPHRTLRNLWQLSAYVPTKNLQIEFLNKWRNKNIYGENNPFAPFAVPFEYQFAITMMAQPLAWFEGTGLPKEALGIGSVIKKYRSIQSDIHSGDIYPIGDEPCGYGWTGFQSIKNESSGYLLVFREKNKETSRLMKILLPVGEKVILTPVLGEGKTIKAISNSRHEVQFELPHEFSYCLYKYAVGD